MAPFILVALLAIGIALKKYLDHRDDSHVRRWTLWVETPEHVEMDFGIYTGTKNAARLECRRRAIQYVVQTGNELCGTYHVVSA